VPIDLRPLIEPHQTALVVFECQEALLGESSPLPGLAGSAKQVGLLANISGLLTQARTAGARVVYVVVAKRPDGVESPLNTPLERRIRSAGGVAFNAGPVCAEIAPVPGDVVIERQFGLTGFYESGLDATLRNCGVKTIVLAGVSLNLGVIGTAIEAVNRSYTVVVAKDCVAADPAEFAEPLLQFSLRNIAYLSSSEEISEIWR
jgi:nicotinamidase-related amidase